MRKFSKGPCLPIILLRFPGIVGCAKGEEGNDSDENGRCCNIGMDPFPSRLGNAQCGNHAWVGRLQRRCLWLL